MVPREGWGTDSRGGMLKSCSIPVGFCQWQRMEGTPDPECGVEPSLVLDGYEQWGWLCIRMGRMESGLREGKKSQERDKTAKSTGKITNTR